MSCDCNPQSDPIESSQNCCPSSFCHAGLINLPERQRLNLMGVETGSKCASTFPRTRRGFVVNDGYGGAIVTEQPTVPVPYLRNLILGPDGKPITGMDGHYQENDPPGFNDLIVTDDCGKMWRWHGRHGYRQKIVWNGCKFVAEADLSEAELADFPVVEGPASCGHYEAVLTDLGGGTFGLGYRQTASRFAGEITTFAGPSDQVPPGWLICDGSTYDPVMYPDLFANIGFSWGKAGDLFRVPDLRGQFLRGVDDSAGIDPNANTRHSKYPGGNSGDAVGSYQDDAFQRHNHSLSSVADVGPSTGADTGINNANTTITGGDDLATVGQATELGGGPVRLSDETRPKNASVYFLIFAGCAVQ